ncbi:YciI-like protein [Streptantibioticus cattleyicolor]|uniref:YciI-like protein n=1 Tax=Streptantibioticus cattleyicolor (strain ATCC 35852 / DSM 46488 / JCM 4925 / NBRC 14057 / NRRL 8057) TaxID=1003195 RepID=F8JL58_STREN|nr:YciI-like protein [Streptantibioticus cattleyicolor]AEW98362.1 YciI-like protein [Streptantibioticus cattleyicolor NRRL 8057 = DSM 46488]CCB72579.1 YCII-related [Streptantibioticus cattleyicolor NRRL 8057 = DSM 46488]
MAYYVLEYSLVDDYVERRAPLREEHLGLARAARERGDLVLAGALAEPVDRALLVWRTDDPSVVEDFARHDPYVREGLVTRWTVRPWSVVGWAPDGTAEV